MKKLTLFIIFCISIKLNAQTDSIPYSRDYIFNGGVYLKLEDFKKNNPILKSQVITDYPVSENDFWKQVVKKYKFKYIDESGQQVTVLFKNTWGFSSGNKIYLNVQPYGFCKLMIVGSLCFFAVDPNDFIPTMSVIQPDPTNPELLPLLPVEKIIYDVESNTRFLADYKNMEQLLKREPELLSEYMALNVKARKNSIMIYLRKYNEKRALYLSEK